MKENFKRKLVKFVLIAALIFLCIGIVQNAFTVKDSDTHKKIEKDNSSLQPEYYDEDQLAFINWEELYQYFPSIRGAENFKKDLSEYMLERRPEIKMWFVKEVSFINNVLSFKLTYNKVSYVVQSNEYQTLIIKE